MKWAKAKTIFIIIFLFVNIFLYVIYRMNSDEGKQIDMQSVATVLRTYNINANTDSFNSLPSELPQFEAKQLHITDTFAADFFDGEVKTTNGEYITKTEKATFSENGIDYKNSAPSSRSFNGINKHNAPSKITNNLEKRGMQKNILSVERVSENGNNGFTVTFSYSYNGRKILNQNLYVTAGNNGITEIKGPLLSLSEIKNGIYHTVSLEVALLDFISFYGEKQFNAPSDIIDFEIGYYVSSDSVSLSAYALPAYKINFADGRSFYLDGRTNIEPEFILLNK